MNRFKGKIKVVNEDRLCFPVDPKTLKPDGPSVFNPWFVADDGEIEQINLSEWIRRKHANHN